MNRGAHNADVRISVINARKIQAALRQGVDAKRVIAAYQRTNPHTSKNPAQDRARARAWAMLNMRINNEPLLAVLQRTWAEGFVLGQAYGDDEILRAREAKKVATDYVDWNNWKPGDAATATLLRPPKAFQELLGRARVTIKDLDITGYDRVGTALADSIEQGLSSTRAAKLITEAIGNPARALSIAVTETNRAMSFGAISRYKEANLEQMEWATSDPCPACAVNSGQVINIGGTFNSGANQPPAHPHCRCALLPVIPEFAPNEQGVVLVEPPKPAEPAKPVKPAAPKVPRKSTQHKSGAWSEPVKGDEALAELKEARRASSMSSTGKPYAPAEWNKQYTSSSKLLDEDMLGKTAKEQATKVVYRNGPTIVIVDPKNTMKVPIQQILDRIDILQSKNPIKNLTLTIDNSSMKRVAKSNPNTVFGCASRFGSTQTRSFMWLNSEFDMSAPYAYSNGYKMLVDRATQQVTYTLTHEWGHVIEEGSVWNVAPANARVKTVIGKEGTKFLSGYGKTERAEAYAECFAQWTLTKGKTSNPLVIKMAKEFNW